MEELPGDHAALNRLRKTSRTRLAMTPTPLLSLPRLARRLGASAELFVKADAWTGFGLGGNKVRKLEYELAPERLDGVTRLITAGGPHSNHCRVTAAAAARLGVKCTLVINGEPKSASRGNAFLHRLFGARIVTVAERGQRDSAMAEEARRVARQGGKARIVPLGASTPRGALGYVRALCELQAQTDGSPARIFVPSSSGGTMAGLVLGCAVSGGRPRLVAVSADDPAPQIKDAVATLAAGAAELLAPGPSALADQTRQVAEAVVVTDAFVGAGYGRPTPASEEATHLFATAAGLVLDPFYTAKAAAAMVSWVRANRLERIERVVFLHTGGHPALFR